MFNKLPVFLVGFSCEHNLGHNNRGLMVLFSLNVIGLSGPLVTFYVNRLVVINYIACSRQQHYKNDLFSTEIMWTLKNSCHIPPSLYQASWSTDRKSILAPYASSKYSISIFSCWKDMVLKKNKSRKKAIHLELRKRNITSDS